MATTLEEAKRCPKCSQPGDHRLTTTPRNVKPGTRMLHVFCTSPLCSWYDTSWVIQINPDGSIPDASMKALREDQKVYPKLQPIGNDEERILNAIEKQLAQEQKPGGGELRGRG